MGQWSVNDFQFIYVIACAVFTTLGLLFAIESNQRLGRFKQSERKKPLILYSFIIGATLWGAHQFAALSTGLSFTTDHYLLYISWNLIASWIGCAILLTVAQRKLKETASFIAASILFASFILIADIPSFYVLFDEHIVIHPLLLLVSLLLTWSMTIPMFRFLLLIHSEDYSSRKWKVFGIVASGLALSCVPYMLFVGLFQTPTTDFSYLIPYVCMITANVLLMLVPDTLGDEVRTTNVEAFKSLFHHNPIAIFSTDPKGYILDVNDQAASLTEFSPETLKNLHIYNLVSQADRNAISAHLQGAMTGEVTHLNTTLIPKSGEKKSIRITAVRNIVKGRVVGAFGLVEDITEQLQSRSKIEYLAYHDDLTGLPNRRKLEQLTMEDLQDVSFLLMDFDRFKRINDTFGHSFGDSLLKKLAVDVKEMAEGYGATAIRLGGDEFLVVCMSKDAHAMSETLLAHFDDPLIVEGVELSITTSIGYAYGGLAGDQNELLKFADMSMYASKEKGGHTATPYIPEQFKGKEVSLSIEKELSKALAEERLEVYYQPKYSVCDERDSQLFGAEALARWTHAEWGPVSPATFIPIAEESRMIVTLENLVIKKVVAQMEEWKRAGRAVFRVSINLSLATILQQQFIPYVKATLRYHGISGDLIEFELTERMVMQNEREVNAKMREMQSMGITISIDDFGTGYSSLSYLHQLSIDRLKIDQSFVQQDDAKGIIASIIQMADSLNLRVIAEGVENEQQLQTLRELGCTEVQGFYFGRPVPAYEYERQYLYLMNS
ncbi:EAL domain-containing protein [Halobacillus locisalis]|uniref:EAL domain-containing protein n=1 Tax=Halobacillus locisalis TaxID=220753 RepID=A0A838CW48_9BACI|nr:GGDEF domain-containing phosphodiesterase [Halobacillus locisalis]MBA2176190.1 EAL domain-containing protein [Halobacillus locisalis]